MKKSLLALAAMGAFVGAAQAQSSVTVYGVIDKAVSSTTTTQAQSTARNIGRQAIGKKKPTVLPQWVDVLPD